MQILLYANTDRTTSRVAAIHKPELYANLLNLDRVGAEMMWKQAAQDICYTHQLPACLCRYARLVWEDISSLFLSHWVLSSVGTTFPGSEVLFLHQACQNGSNSNSHLSENRGNRLQPNAMLLQVVHQHHLEARYTCRPSGAHRSLR